MSFWTTNKGPIKKYRRSSKKEGLFPSIKCPKNCKIHPRTKSNDGRVLINLTGVTRFKILEEISNKKLYREFKVDYKNFIGDIDKTEIKVNTGTLMDKAQTFFKRSGLLLNWKEFEKLDHTQQINTLAMIAPITNEEKQKILESISLENKIKSLENIISFYLFETNFKSNTIQ